MWALEKERDFYEINHIDDDTLRVVMMGDSWAGMHKDFDEQLNSMLMKKFGGKASFVSKGKGGEKTKGIYQLMYERGEYGTKSILLSSPNYCIITAGINDAAANIGTRQYCYYYKQLLEFLLKNYIRPVIIEIPNVNIWTVSKHKPTKDLLSDFMKSTMVGCGMYKVEDYRKALLLMLEEEKLINQVLYVPIDSWNGRTPELNISLFLDDQIHLNSYGYQLLDSTIACKIFDDYHKW